MPRHPRNAPGGFVYHALDRATLRLTLFRKPADYDAFLRIFDAALVEVPIRLLAFCVMPTHWHLVLWPQREDQLTGFLRWLAHTHAMRWHTHCHSLGSGHLYQGRFKSFPIEADDHLYTVLRYVERNPLRTGLVRRAEEWPWSSLGLRHCGPVEAERWLSAWPVAVPENWVEWVKRPQTEGEPAAVRRSVVRGCPYGSAVWAERVASRPGLESTMRPRGRQSKKQKAGAEPALAPPKGPGKRSRKGAVPPFFCICCFCCTHTAAKRRSRLPTARRG
jgi:putative transposase